MPWEKVTLIGVGLLGGSIGCALRKKGLAELVVGYVRRESTIAEAKDCEAIDHGTLDLPEAVGGADLIILCTPVGAMPALVEKMLWDCRAGALLTDVGSVKAEVGAKISEIVAQSSVAFVGSHPMAGAEKTGVARSSAELFEGAVCIMTPGPETPQEATDGVRRFWNSLGGQVVEMDPSAHDRHVSRASHLPHVAAALLAHEVLDPEADSLRASLCATGFRDTTRIAAGDVTMWRDILVQNSVNIGEALDNYIGTLAKFRQALGAKNVDQVVRFLETARYRRMRWEQSRDGAA
ncbi:MAG: Prephenate dehydrogenase [Verrucomicrobia subdivision 3 bacterium]|nr:Prephenate dehydrogenase [Limisphaerales bacterium]MCS1412781.1 Prephenate dehydrogenase [Limisphaerales bacterium]